MASQLQGEYVACRDHCQKRIFGEVSTILEALDSLSERLRVGRSPVIGREGSGDCGGHPDPDPDLSI